MIEHQRTVLYNLLTKNRCQHKMTNGTAPGGNLLPPQLHPPSPLSERE